MPSGRLLATMAHSEKWQFLLTATTATQRPAAFRIFLGVHRHFGHCRRCSAVHCIGLSTDFSKASLNAVTDSALNSNTDGIHAHALTSLMHPGENSVDNCVEIHATIAHTHEYPNHTLMHAKRARSNNERAILPRKRGRRTRCIYENNRWFCHIPSGICMNEVVCARLRGCNKCKIHSSATINICQASAHSRRSAVPPRIYRGVGGGALGIAKKYQPFIKVKRQLQCDPAHRARFIE